MEDRIEGENQKNKIEKKNYKGVQTEGWEGNLN